MRLVELAFASGEDSLSVHSFAVREAMSSLFEAQVLARSPNEDLDLDAIVGKPASLRIAGGSRGVRVYAGICNHLEQEEAEETGVSSYRLRIVPALWLLTQRTSYRVFQHSSAPEIATAILAEWGIEAKWKLGRAGHPKLEYRVQYGESDFAFLSRTLEEAGITYTFADEDGKPSTLLLLDAPHHNEPRAGGPIRFVDQPNDRTDGAYVTRVRVAQEVRPGKVSIRDHDFRKNPDYKLVGTAAAQDEAEARLEQYTYAMGSFVTEGHKGGNTPVADAAAVARADEKEGRTRAERQLAAERATRRQVHFHTNTLDLAPGTVFAIGHHPRADLSAENKLLVTELSIEGSPDGEWKAKGAAVFSAQPYFPRRATPKPRAHGVESAVVVGPRGQEIHTDEFGRVQVQFHWDRQGQFDQGSSCWLRVSQGWAGGGYGMVAIPRIGHEVLVGFFGGDPDQPIVVGRVHNGASPLPYKLPENKTKSTWRSASSPSAGGCNEITFEDAGGAELLYVQAERNLEKLVKADESVRIGGSRGKSVGVNENVAIGGNRATTIGGVDAAVVGARHSVTVASGAGATGGPTGLDMVDRRISLSTGEATITLEGPNITLEAAAGILLNAGANIALAAGAHVTVNSQINMTLKSGATLVVQAEDGDVVIQGGPIVQINPTERRSSREDDDALPVQVPEGVDLAAQIEDAERRAWFDPDAPDWFRTKMKSGEWDFAEHGEEHRDFASFHLGAVGKAAGLPEGVILRQAGLRKKERGELNPDAGDPGNGLFGGQAPYGVEPRELEMMQKGFAFYDRQSR